MNTKPKKVQSAVVMLYIVLALGVINTILGLPTSTATTSIGNVVLVAFLTLVIIGFFVVMISRGKNWTRITFLVLFLLGALPSIPYLIRGFTPNPVSGFVGLVQVVLEILALVFLFQRESSEWFKNKAKPTE